MQPDVIKKVVVILGVIALIVGGILLFLNLKEDVTLPVQIEEPIEEIVKEPDFTYTEIGTSVEGRVIGEYTYGNGPVELLFVGGMHGGYEWNSVLLAYQIMDYFEENPDAVPENISVTVIPSINPDGVFDVIGIEGRFEVSDVPSSVSKIGLGRFNANNVDLNRNFNCKWKPESTWKGNVVSAGSEAFSEPEAVALRDFVFAHNPRTVVFWHSQANAVYASECESEVLLGTLDAMNAYAEAADYIPVKSFDAYEITGDAEGWLASINIPAITVELKTHETIEFEKNVAGVKALFSLYPESQ